MNKVTKRVGIALAALLVGSGLTTVSASPAAAEPTAPAVVVQDTAPAAQDTAPEPAKVTSLQGEDCDEVTEPDGDVEYTFTTCASASSAVTVASQASGKAAVDQQGRLILSFIMPDGIPESGQKQCKRIPAGQTYVNNYYDSTGKVRWKEKTAGPGGVKICFYQGKWRVVKCGNVVIMRPPPAIVRQLVKGKVVIRSRQKIYSEAKSEAEGTSTSAVKATQVAGSCAGTYATASADGAFFAIARARAWGWSKRSSLIALQGEIERLQIEQSSRDQARAKAMTIARGNAKTAVNAKIVCNSQEEHKIPTAELFVGEHAVDEGGTMPVFGRAKAFDGATVVLGSPRVTPSNLGGIYNWRTVSTERDGVTPCETGFVCYQGYFRAGPGTPGTTVYGTLEADARDSMNSTFTTSPVQFAVEYRVHPDM